MFNEYGGTLHLEKIDLKNNPYLKYDCMKLSSGRLAIYMAVKDYNATILYLPLYICPSVKKYLLSNGIKVKEYNLDNNFMPLVETLNKDEMILWVNYFGCMFSEIKDKVIDKYKNQLILDNSQALFDVPIYEADNYFVYSCRKFFGIPDGAILVKKNIKKENEFLLTNNYDTSKWGYLLEASKHGSNYVYNKYLENEESFCNRYDKMSFITEQYLNAINWDKVKAIRKENFNILHNNLFSKNDLNIDFNTETPFMYPFYNTNENLRSKLLENNIFVPTIWKHVISSLYANENEKKWAKYIIPITIDQRYNSSDMLYITKFIKQVLKE